MKPSTPFLALAAIITTEGFQISPPTIATTSSSGISSSRRRSIAATANRRHNIGASRSSSTSVSATETDDATSTGATTLTKQEIQTLFTALADTTLLYDPSRGTCCRNKCSGCTYLDPTNGNFVYDEYTADDNEELGGWLAPYVKVDFGERVETSKWSKILFPYKKVEGSSYAQPPKEVEREQFANLLGVDNISLLALQSLWNVLSPSAGYPRLSSTEVTRAIKGMEGSAYDMGGAVDYAAFEKNMKDAADQIIQLGGVDSIDAAGTAMDYDSMSKEELLEECVSRGMKTSFPKMKRIIIEELRFFDANGRQGKRHPVKNTLS